MLPVGSEFQVNTYTTSGQLYPAVGPDGAGGFVVLWTSGGSSGSDDSAASIQGQRYASSGATAGDQFQVNTYTSGYQFFPAVSPDGAGGFVVVWGNESLYGTDPPVSSIQGQRYASDGSTVGDEFQVNTYTTSYQSLPAVGPDGAGGFVVAWESNGSSGSDNSYYSIQGQRYASDGSTAGDQFQVNTYTTDRQDFPAVGLDGAGGFVIVWHSDGSSGSDGEYGSIQGQRYASDGSTVGDEFQVNTYTTSGQSRPAVGPDGAGGFVVVWESFGSSGSDDEGGSIQGQRYASDGSTVDDQFQVNTYTTSSQSRPAVGSDGAGGFVVVWHSDGSSGSDYDSYSIQGQRYGPPIFEDGFESGDTSAWSNTVP